ncbi:M48 family metalloprotease [Sessilibacter corallicola]|uniref:M48 family metalloprotease n=1 Tax=Sessilibacter corallicola TaxID=2904075 RepID=UPI003D9C739B
MTPVTKTSRKIAQRTLLAMLLSLPLPYTISSSSAEIQLPDLGDGASSIISPAREKKLGQAWLRSYRSQVRTSSDPLMYEYLETLIQDLAKYSQLKDQSLDLVVVPNPTINAFAVPGGVVGVNTGLFLYAGNENQMASVLAHELAHLSQRHFARSLEKQSNSTIPTMAGLLASLILAATAGGDAGIAALTATQAAALDSRLRFSRQNEQEADRIGLQTMVASGRNPAAGAEMFERMLRELRYTSRPPEFLLTHPITESRVADARNRAQKHPEKQYVNNDRFYLMQARSRLLHAENANIAAKTFAYELEGDTPSENASRYGLALALTESGQFDRAYDQIQYLLENEPDENAYIIAMAKLEAKQGEFDSAQRRLESELRTRPKNHPLNTALAEILMDGGRYSQAEVVLTKHSTRRPKDDYIWYLLAEVRGLAGNILGLHQARAEYFMLNGIYDKARTQLKNAKKIAKSDYQKAILDQRLKDLERMRNEKL